MGNSNNKPVQSVPDKYVLEVQNPLPAARTPSLYALGELNEQPVQLEAKTSQYNLEELRTPSAGFQSNYHYVAEEGLKAPPVKNLDKTALTKAELLKYLDGLEAGYYTVQITSGRLEPNSSASDVTSSTSTYSTSEDTRTPLEDGTSEDSATYSQPAKHMNVARGFGSEIRTSLDEEPSKHVSTAQQPTDCGFGSEVRTALDEESSKNVATAQQPTDLETDHAYILPSGLILVNLAQLSTPQDSELVTGLERTPVNSETSLQAGGVDAGQNFVMFDLNTARELSQTEVNAVETAFQSAFPPVDVNLTGSDVHTAIEESTDKPNRDQV